jgi:hypothetical protein
MRKEALPDGTLYVFRHRKLGILGRIRIQERAAGGSHLVAEVAGDPADPMTTERAALFEPLARSVSAFLPIDTGACGAQRANWLSRVRARRWPLLRLQSTRRIRVVWRTTRSG